MVWDLKKDILEALDYGLFAAPKVEDGIVLIDYYINPIDVISMRINNRFDELENRINEMEELICHTNTNL